MGVEDIHVRVVNFVLTAIAILATVFRLWDRERTGRLWWDDAWAALCVVLLILFMGATEVHLEDPSRHSKKVKIAVAYMSPFIFYAVTWSSRLSILLTIIRISLGRLRKFLVFTGVAFSLVMGVLFAQVWWVCEGHPQWKESYTPQCHLGLNVVVARVITDSISDAIVILAPVLLVWRTSLSRPQKIRIMAIFSATLLTTGVSMNHAYFVLTKGGIEEELAAVIQCTISLVVANMSVIIAFFFRITTEEPQTWPTMPVTNYMTSGVLAGTYVPPTSPHTPIPPRSSSRRSPFGLHWASLSHWSGRSTHQVEAGANGKRHRHVDLMKRLSSDNWQRAMEVRGHDPELGVSTFMTREVREAGGQEHGFATLGNGTGLETTPTPTFDGTLMVMSDLPILRNTHESNDSEGNRSFAHKETKDKGGSNIAILERDITESGEPG